MRRFGRITLVEMFVFVCLVWLSACGGAPEKVPAEAPPVKFKVGDIVRFRINQEKGIITYRQYNGKYSVTYRAVDGFKSGDFLECELESEKEK